MESFQLRPAGRNQSVHFEPELAGCSALIIDSDNTSRSVLTAQMRDFGFSEIAQQSRLLHARELLETRRFDVVLCAQYFAPDSPTGQDFLDELRRDALLPFSTVFIMVTTEASYAKVEQAAESALDGYLLKPHSAASLAQRLLAARRRKQELNPIFDALEHQQLETAITLCEQRYHARANFWLYCARMGGELLLRTGQFGRAQNLYASVAQATGEAWARAGVARAMLSGGQYSQAMANLHTLIENAPDFVDAYDVLGRAQLKLGMLAEAMLSFRQASDLTPSSIARLQRLGMLAYYLGDGVEAERLLDQATLLGQDSRSYDYQTLALLALLRAAQENWSGVHRCVDIAHSMLRRTPDGARLQRVCKLVEGVSLLHHYPFDAALAITDELGADLRRADFDFDLACNLLSLMAMLADAGAHLTNVNALVMRLGHRFCTGDATCALLEAAAKPYPPFVDLIRHCNEELLAQSEQAMKLHLEGDFRAAIATFMSLADTHLNARLYEAAHQLFLRHGADMSDAATFQTAMNSLRDRIGLARARPGAGDTQGRPPAGVVLRVSAPLPEVQVNW